MMLERQREGIAKAKAEGKYRGRRPVSEAQGLEVLRLAKEGVTKASIAKQLSIGEATVYRLLSAARKS
jgi:DNA invertase Pin-like site-specific DNA recombinase